MKLKETFRYRNIWMSFATLWVMFFHWEAHFGSTVISFLQKIGYGGVDIFMFASGLGCWFSLSKNPQDYAGFMKRRLLRILPSYFPVIIPWWIFFHITQGADLQSLFGNLFCFQYLTSSEICFDWYVCAILIFYLLTPYLYSIVQKTKKPGSCILFFAALLLFSFIFQFSGKTVIIASRLPIYVLGMYFARYSDTELSKKILAVLYAVSAAGIALLVFSLKLSGNFLWNSGLAWYPFLLITPGLCIFMSRVCALICKCSFGEKLLSLIGKIGNCSFEFYLIHVSLFSMLPVLFQRNILTASRTIWGLTAIIVFPLAFLLRYIVNKIMHRITKIKVFIHAVFNIPCREPKPASQE